MSTPAEIIAARVNGLNSIDDTTYLGISSVSDSDEASSIIDEVENNSITTSVPSISDETAFPALGGKKTGVPNATPSWGPSMKAPTWNNTSGGSSNTSSPVVGSGKLKVSTIQEAFSLDVEDQLNVAKPEFIKILTAIKTDTKTNIECTTSQHTKKRTFLITGKPNDVKLAKRLVIKKLTKPVKISFTVPAKIRSRIIGAQGRTLKPIIQANEVKIDIGNVEEFQEASDSEDEDDVFAKTVKVVIEGDIEGCKHAKAQILAIVKEETKYLSSKVKVDALIKPYIQNELKQTVDKFDLLDIAIPDYKSLSSNIVIVGEREIVSQAKEEIKDILSNLSEKIVIEEVPIPKLKHQFLPIDTILKEDNVLIKLPEEGESNVKFIGDKMKIPLAQEKARKATSQYKVEVLDMSKAHKGNLKHVKAVAALLNSNGVFKNIADTNGVVINVPDEKALIKPEVTSVPIEIIVKVDEAESTKNTKKSIVSVVNRISPDSSIVIEDIDEFLISKVPETIDEVAKKNNVLYVILGNSITLFSNENEEEDFDFVDTSDASASLIKVNESLNKLRELASNLQTFVLNVPSKEQEGISGPRGTTLKSILTAVEPNSVVVKLHSNESGKSDDEIYIHGIKSEVATVKKSIELALADYREFKDDHKTSVSVPTFILSRLIGKNGSNMNSLRDEFGVKINIVEDNNDPNDKNAKTEISIVGVKRNSDDCKARIQQYSKKWADEALVRLKIESQYHRRMIGTNGIYINRLQDKYNVKIRFPSADNMNSNFADAPKSKDEVTIKGPSKGVAKAEEELRELYQFEKENGFKQTIQIPTKAIARVIGKSGETINDIADGTGVEYKFNRDSENEEKLGYADVELTGSKTALKEATKNIQEIIDEIENFVSVTIKVDPKYHRDLIGSGGSVMKEIISKAGGDNFSRAKYFKLLTIPNEGSGSDEVTSQGHKSVVNKVIDQVKQIIATKEASIAVDYDLPKEKHRLIVGTGGSIRHSLQDEFDVSIEIPRPNDISTIIKLHGLPENIEKLTERLNALTKDDWNISIDIPEVYHVLVSERGAIFKKLKSDFNVEVQHGNLTRKAAKLSSSLIPTPPESAYPTAGETTKFTIAESKTDLDTSNVIPWRLKGDVKNTEKAADLIKERLETAKSARSVGWFYSKNTSLFSKIVGPQGSTVNQIRNESNTFITVPRSNDKNSNFIYLVGSEANLKTAKDRIEDLIR